MLDSSWIQVRRSHRGVGGKSRIKTGRCVFQFPQAQKSLLMERAERTRIMFLLYLLSFSLWRLSVGFRKSKTQIPRNRPLIVPRRSEGPNEFVQKGALWSPMSVHQPESGNFPAVLKPEPEGKLSLSQANTSCCLGFFKERKPYCLDYYISSDLELLSHRGDQNSSAPRVTPGRRGWERVDSVSFTILVRSPPPCHQPPAFSLRVICADGERLTGSRVPVCPNWFCLGCWQTFKAKGQPWGKGEAFNEGGKDTWGIEKYILKGLKRT